jgi:hypothetical protein
LNGVSLSACQPRYVSQFYECKQALGTFKKLHTKWRVDRPFTRLNMG